VAFRFGDYVLDIERRELRRGAEPVALEPQVFDLLVYLVRNRGRVVGKDDLIEGVWGGSIGWRAGPIREGGLRDRVPLTQRTMMRITVADDPALAGIASGPPGGECSTEPLS
jgi:hypothetical protein